MNKSLYILQVLIVFILFVKCSSPDKKDTGESKFITINLENANPETFESLFAIEEIIAIKGSEGIPIKSIKRVLSRENNYWLLTSSKILRLDSNGGFLDSISRLGNGPGEFQSVDDIRWNENSSLIEVLDRNSGKLLRFNPEGEFQNEWNNPYLYLATSFMPDGDDYFIYGGVFFEGDGYRAVLVSGISGEKKKGFSKIENERRYLSVLNNDTFYAYNEEIEFFYSDNDTLYTLSEYGSTIKHILDFGKSQTPREFFDRSFENIMDFRNQAAANDYASVFSIQPTDSHFFFFVIQGSKFYTAIVDRTTNEVKVVKGWSSEFGNDFSDLSSYLVYTPIGSDRHFLYFSIDPYTIKSEIDKLNENPSLPEFLKTNPYLHRIYQDFDKYENPYILKIRVNELN
ncbi:MAG: 6-bladed beta-propeller [Mongoliibacter sp.]|uniref:6-bladed beta-propeller n=1 Tax=Mongoliibacter sp. TaxID=2022438 RepID=UPI0012F302AC|nr:6-bladed beta-propeller [Mongoliibacter sp.]TVP53971.1 MAG: 6-bladed beta-propeller [Mongoliibacter sp.]